MPVNCDGITLGGSGLGGIKTSGVDEYDGAATPNIPTPASPTLNDIIEAINSALGGLTTPASSGILWDGAITIDCITFTGAVQTVNSVIADLIAQICANETCCENNTEAIANLCATDIEICEEITTTCIGDEAITIAAGTTLQAGLAYMLQLICDNYIIAGAITTGVNSDIWDDFGTTDPTDPADVTEWVGAGGHLDTGSGDLEPDITNPDGGNSVYIWGGIHYELPTTGVLLEPMRDNYIRFRADTSEYIVYDVAFDDPEPPLGDMQMTLWKATTNVISVTASTDLRNLYNQDGTRWTDNSVKTRHITDADVTGAKLEDFGTGIGTFDIGLGSLGLDAKGRVSSYASSVIVGGLADKQVLQYDAATTTWTNVDISTAGGLPAGTEEGETIRWSNSLLTWEATDVIKILGTTISINSAPDPTASGIEFSSSGEVAFEIAVTELDPPTPLATGTLPANTYFYVLTSIDANGDESYIGNEENQTIDGVTHTSIALSWAVVNGAHSYRLYRGLDVGAENEYTDLGDVTEIVDDNTLVYVAGVPPSSGLSWKVLLSSLGLGYGKTPTLGTPSYWYDVQGNVETMHDIEVAGLYDDSAPTITGIKSHVHADNPTGVNVSGWFMSLNEGVGGTSHVFRLEDGNDNTGKFLQVTDALGHVDFVASSATFALDTLWNSASQESETNAIDFKGDLISNFTVDGGGGVEITFDATASNVGAGTGNVFKQKVVAAAPPTPVDFEFKTLVGSAGISVVDGVDEITISASGAIGVFTEDTVGSGHNIFGGTGAGTELTAGATDAYHNFLAGINAGKELTDNTSFGNTIIGSKAGANLTTDTQKNTLIGNEVLEGNPIGVANTNGNVGLGNGIGQDWANGGDDNIFVGSDVGEHLSGGSSNIYLGGNAQNPFATASGVPLGTEATAADTDRTYLVASGLQESDFTGHLLLGNMDLPTNSGMTISGGGSGIANDYRLLVNGGQCNPFGLKPQASLHVVSAGDGLTETAYFPLIITQGFDMSDYETDFSDSSNRHDLFTVSQGGHVTITPKNVIGSSAGIDIEADGTSDSRLHMRTDLTGSDHYYGFYLQDTGLARTYVTQDHDFYTGSTTGNKLEFFLGTDGLFGALTPRKWISAEITSDALGAIQSTQIDIESVGVLGEINITSTTGEVSLTAASLNLNGFTLPTGVGLLGQQLVSDGAGGVSWDNGIAQDQISYDMQEKTFADSTAVMDIHAFVMVDTSLGAPMFFLPTGTDETGKKIYLKKMTGDANNVNIRPQGGGTIDGLGTTSLTLQYEVGCFIQQWLGAVGVWHRVDV